HTDHSCVLSPLLFTLLTHDCATMHSSNHIVKFANDTTMAGLASVQRGQESPAALLLLAEAEECPSTSPIKTMFYRGTIESVLSSCITAWFGNCTVSEHKTLQRIVKTAEKIIGVSLPSITDMYTTRCIRKANSPSHTLFTLLWSGKRYRSIRALTTRLCNSF
ncbi:hypothetical protein QTP70_014904, partial [Hemibagrus guttatus]